MPGSGWLGRRITFLNKDMKRRNVFLGFARDKGRSSALRGGIDRDRSRLGREQAGSMKLWPRAVPERCSVTAKEAVSGQPGTMTARYALAIIGTETPVRRWPWPARHAAFTGTALTGFRHALANHASSALSDRLGL